MATLSGGDSAKFTLQKGYGVGLSYRFKERWELDFDVSTYKLYSDSTARSSFALSRNDAGATRTWQATRLAVLANRRLFAPENLVNMTLGIGGGLMIWRFANPIRDTTLDVRGALNETVDKVRRKAVTSFWIAGGAGLATQLLIVPVLVIVCLILAISLIGIPLIFLLLPIVVLAFLIAALVGFSAVAIGVGRWSERRFGWQFGSPYMALLVGVLIINSLAIVSDTLGMVGGFLTAFTIMFGLAGFLIEYVAWTVGLGAVILHLLNRSGSSPTSAAAAGEPEPPSPPALPPTTREPAAAEEASAAPDDERLASPGDRPDDPPDGRSGDS